VNSVDLRTTIGTEGRKRFNVQRKTRFLCLLRSAVALLAVALLATGAKAQVSVLTAHNDIARTGQNLNETVLTPANVNPTQFGRLFSQTIVGAINAQPLVVSQLVIPGKGTFNVVYVVTTSDVVYAFDADSNGGTSSTPLWQVSLLNNSTPAGTLTNEYGIIGTPVIDRKSLTMYLVSSELQGSTYLFRVHALDIATGAEKAGSPVLTQATVPGTGVASVNGSLSFDGSILYQRPGLLLLNGVLYTAFGSFGDNGPWHGWIFSYNAATLQMIDAYCTTPNGMGAGLWMGGAGLAAEVNNPATKPYGRMFVATGNGSYASNSPYTNAMSYGMSVLDLDLTGGQITAEDEFTPYNEHFLNGQDADLGAGGPILLPTETLASGKILNALVQIGKGGTFYILDRDNNADGSNNPATEYSPAGLGGFNATGDQIEQEVQPPVSTGKLNWGPGVWGTEAYWNNNVYSGGTNPDGDTYDGTGNSLTAYSYANGVFSSTPTSQSVEQYTFPGPTPSVSANGAADGIVWVIKTDPFDSPAVGYETLVAYDATNLGKTLYSSNTNLARDNPGLAERFIVPTIANGRVFVGAGGELSFYGLLNSIQTAPAPAISPSGSSPVTFTGTQTVTITDAIAGATIYYTTDGTTPTPASAKYTKPLVISTNETITAIASANSYLQSPPASVAYQSTNTTVNPVFSLAAGTYSGAQTLIITDSSPNPKIYYTLDGTPPTTASPVYSGPLTIPVTETVQALAVSAGLFASPAVSATFTIQPAYVFNFTNGFAGAEPMQFNGSTDLDDFRLQLTNGGLYEAGSAFYGLPVNIQSFTTDFTFQLSNPAGDGITFTIQGDASTALGSHGAGLGYAGIPKSVAIKFDLFSNAGEGPNSTGLYINGAVPTVPAINLTGTGIDLHDGDYFDAHITYDGVNLILTLTDYVTLATWSQSFPVNIPTIVGGANAYVGFTGGTGGSSSSQKILSWTYQVGAVSPNYPTGFDAVGMSLNRGSAMVGNRVRLTDGKAQEARSAFFTTPVNVQQFYTSFDIQLTNPNADGMTFTIQGNSAQAVGSPGQGLGYTPDPTYPTASQIGTDSLAIKFDLYNNEGEGPDSTGLYLNGAVPTVPAINLSTTGINLHSGDIFNVQLAYDGTTLTEVIIDTATLASVTETYPVNIPSVVGANSAYVGFTAGSGGAGAVQDVLNWTYSGAYSAPVTGVPPTIPNFSNGFNNVAGLILNGGAALDGTALSLTDGDQFEARSVFFATPLSVAQFNTSFNFQLTDAAADGFTFTIQGVGPNALGAEGGSLGYGGIPTSVAVKFDLYSNAGEGPNSTGLYTDGAVPTVPAIDLSATGLNLHSGDEFSAQLTYSGTTLTVVITDLVTSATSTQTYTVNIPALVGGSTAYFGFTAGSGGSTAIQKILTWSYSAIS
jgi:hypothetical protein